MFAKFEKAYAGLATRDLQDLKIRLGGQVGRLRVGSETQVVLRLGENVYVSSDKPSLAIRTAVSLEQSDLHVVKTNADVVHFARRYRDFKGALDAEAPGKQ
jgi:hypothetical protein